MLLYSAISEKLENLESIEHSLFIL